jgi:serine/threonine protein phosphatase PrpC
MPNRPDDDGPALHANSRASDTSHVVLRASGVTDKGRIRSTNEDCFAVREDLGLCVIADGMGGHNAGEVASRLAVDAVVETCGGTVPATWPFGYEDSLSADGNLLRTAIHRANVSILETAITSDRYTGMGTTVVAARVANGRLVVAHAGDSRLYVLADGALRQLTRDDSWMATILATDPGVDQNLLMNHPMRNALTNVVGAGARTDVHVVEEPVASGALLLLTTDGVHGVMEDGQLERLIADADDLEATAANVIAAALARGSRDNCTAIVARVCGI